MKKKLKLSKKTIASLENKETVVGGDLTGKVCVTALPTFVCDTKLDCYPSAIECCNTCHKDCLTQDFDCNSLNVLCQ